MFSKFIYQPKEQHFLHPSVSYKQRTKIFYMLNMAEPIGKEGLNQCTFRKPFQRFSDSDIRERNQRLFLAMLMGNNYRSQARIIFNTIDGYKAIFTTIWATTEKFILLKEGNVIPLESIAAVELQ